MSTARNFRKPLRCRLGRHRKPYGVQYLRTDALKYCTDCGSYINPVAAFQVIKKFELRDEAMRVMPHASWHGQDRYVRSWMMGGYIKDVPPRPVGFVSDQVIRRRVKRGVVRSQLYEYLRTEPYFRAAFASEPPANFARAGIITLEELEALFERSGDDPPSIS